MSKIVPNEPPTLLSPLPYRLAIIGDCPRESDEDTGRPFTGTHGQFLNSVLQQHGILRSACLVANVADTYVNLTPSRGSKVSRPYSRDEYLTLERSKEALVAEIASFKPNAILLLGDLPLQIAGIQHGSSVYRGSTFICQETSSPFYGLKCISSLHPVALFKEFEKLPLFSFDVKRAKEEAHSPTLTRLDRSYEVDLGAQEIIFRLDAISDGQLVSVDIEGGVQEGITCIGFATSSTSAFIVAPSSFASSEQVRILKAVHRVLSSDKIPKVLQNSLYDNFCLSWKWHCPIRNVRHDTMLMSWEQYPELPKGLGTLTSLHTDVPYYKFERKIADKRTHHRYCCTDAAVTFEIAQKIDSSFTDAQRLHYAFNMQLLPAMMYMEMRGIKYDMEKAKARHAEVRVQQMELQSRIDKYCGFALNVNSPKQMTEALYRRLGFEPQYKKENGRKTSSLTADSESLLNLAKTGSSFIYDILKWRALDGQRKQLEVSSDKDGRVRCAYNLVGTETGRLTCYESPTGSGTNLQTIMKSNRDLYIADDGYDFFQCDLSGADGWTVAAHCKRLGDSTLYDDYLNGIKPARVLAVMQAAGAGGYAVAGLPVAELKALIKSSTIDEGTYNACKMVQHGSSYLMKGQMMSVNILKRSWKDTGVPLYIDKKTCERLQMLFLQGRYRAIPKWQDWVFKQLERSRTLDCASGHIRTFFGRPGQTDTQRAALSHEPQANTTYATMLALHRLWHDPDNRRSDGSLRIEPLHQVHDALCGQYKSEDREWAVAKLRSYFQNPITIAEQQIVIPFEGGYGPDWKHTNEPI